MFKHCWPSLPWCLPRLPNPSQVNPCPLPQVYHSQNAKIQILGQAFGFSLKVSNFEIKDALLWNQKFPFRRSKVSYFDIKSASSMLCIWEWLKWVISDKAWNQKNPLTWKNYNFLFRVSYFQFLLPSWMLLDVKCLLYNLFIAPNCFLLVDFALKGNQGSFFNWSCKYIFKNV